MSKAHDYSPNSSPITLTDVLGRERSINVFFSFTRDLPSITIRLSSPSQNTTILAPLNSAISALPRKPWENQGEYAAFGEQAYEGDEGRERAQENMKRFVEAHIVDNAGGWEEGVKRKTLSGEEVWWTKKGEQIFIQPDNIEVSSTPGNVANGQIWILKGVRNLTA